ncbi:hypothetical protein MTR67_013092 [Solanum verrucosum]|uniref:Secreted protein n=1 Tax=Solanum verrucosum TaxID=315347 RepID=A0AAF0Q9Y1_SOLVR|nr:hypothetical protein MTR67_013092 [Solanum verrucosum]
MCRDLVLCRVCILVQLSKCCTAAKAVCVRKLVKLQSSSPIKSDERRLVKSSSKSPGRPGRGFTPLSKEVSTQTILSIFVFQHLFFTVLVSTVLRDLVPLILVDAYIPSVRFTHFLTIVSSKLL